MGDIFEGLYFSRLKDFIIDTRIFFQIFLNVFRMKNSNTFEYYYVNIVRNRGDICGGPYLCRIEDLTRTNTLKFVQIFPNCRLEMKKSNTSEFSACLGECFCSTPSSTLHISSAIFPACLPLPSSLIS